MKDGTLSKLTITEGGQRATQYKQIIDALPVFCVDKGYKFIDDVIWTNTKLLEAAFLPTYPNATLWLSTYHVEVDVVDATVAADTNYPSSIDYGNATEVSHFRPKYSEAATIGVRSDV